MSFSKRIAEITESVVAFCRLWHEYTLGLMLLCLTVALMFYLLCLFQTFVVDLEKSQFIFCMQSSNQSMWKPLLLLLAKSISIYIWTITTNSKCIFLVICLVEERNSVCFKHICRSACFKREMRKSGPCLDQLLIVNEIWFIFFDLSYNYPMLLLSTVLHNKNIIAEYTVISASFWI